MTIFIRNLNMTDSFVQWLDFAIENQYGLEKEHEGLEFPQWNKGYLESLLDVKEEIFRLPLENDSEENRVLIKFGELTQRCIKMSLLLGRANGFILEINKDDKLDPSIERRVNEFLTNFEKDIKELYYKEVS